ncbi:cystathionine beta-lyase [Falsiroseomonas bella]|uniref:Cystathionine beta-lyase n=1 Tax=Falsiroseomonas bella TaxID=2184016 RepID=A0A317FA12_9PROT|nr:cystathionine beta-lyase [Falsiroseomonas bella]
MTLPRALPLLAVLIGAAGASAQEGRPQAGRTFAEANCARCHAIGATGTSALPAAPAFRDLHRRYPVDQLAEALAEGIGTGHAAMPEFQLEPAQIADLLAYLRTLRR